MTEAHKNNWLVVEDNDDDFFIFHRACARALNSVTLHRADDGVTAKEFLSGRPKLPDFIISDLKMPRMTGLELLIWIRSQPRLAQIPFVMFSSSAHPKDRGDALQWGADGYLVKPSRAEDLPELLKGLWVQHAVYVQRHITETEARVSEVAALVDDLSRTGRDITIHRETLTVLEETLENLRARRDMFQGKASCQG
jgi:CheY-like chemotaxis protein